MTQPQWLSLASGVAIVVFAAHGPVPIGAEHVVLTGTLATVALTHVYRQAGSARPSAPRIQVSRLEAGVFEVAVAGGRCAGRSRGAATRCSCCTAGPGLPWTYLEPLIDELADRLSRGRLPAARPAAVDRRALPYDVRDAGRATSSQCSTASAGSASSWPVTPGAATCCCTCWPSIPERVAARWSSTRSAASATAERRRSTPSCSRRTAPRGRRARRAARTAGDGGPGHRRRPRGVDAAVWPAYFADPAKAPAGPGHAASRSRPTPPRSRRCTRSCPALAGRLAGLAVPTLFVHGAAQPDARHGVDGHGRGHRPRRVASRCSRARGTSPGSSGPGSLRGARRCDRARRGEGLPGLRTLQSSTRGAAHAIHDRHRHALRRARRSGACARRGSPGSRPRAPTARRSPCPCGSCGTAPSSFLIYSKPGHRQAAQHRRAPARLAAPGRQRRGRRHRRRARRRGGHRRPAGARDARTTSRSTRAFIARNSWTPESFAADYSVPLRITATRLRGF